jgi:hypothetical protein
MAGTPGAEERGASQRIGLMGPMGPMGDRPSVAFDVGSFNDGAKSGVSGVACQAHLIHHPKYGVGR